MGLYYFRIKNSHNGKMMLFGLQGLGFKYIVVTERKLQKSKNCSNL